MRFVFTVHDRPNYAGGPIVNARRLLPALKDRGHEPICLIGYWGGDSPTARYLQSRGIECRTVDWPSCTEDFVRWFMEQLIDTDPDVFVSNSTVAAWFASRWARESGIPAIAACRNDDAFHWAMVNQFITGDPDWAVSGLVCVSDFLRDHIASSAPRRTRLCTIPSGVPLPLSATARHDPFHVVYVGRLVEVPKRASRVVDAMCGIVQQIPHATASVVGAGPERVSLESLVATRGLAEKIEFKGVVANDSIQATIARASVILLLSDNEGTPGALMDAMACGIVPVCRELRGGVSELVTSDVTGVLVDDSVDAAVQAVVRLADDSDQWRQMSSNARQRIAADYSLDVAVDRWEQLCFELIQEAGPRRTLRMPARFELPAVQPGLAVEDRRRRSWFRRSLREIERGIRNVRNVAFGRAEPERHRKSA